MRTVQEIYTTYRIPKNLQLHQLRVAGVAQAICISLDQAVDTQLILLACLFHDMGNIIKFDFAQPLLDDDPQGIPHLREIQREFIAQYGTDDHAANKEIAKEIGLPAAAIRIIDGFGFGNLEAVRDEVSMEQKIAKYADLRVAPYGVVSMDERIAEGRNRYLHRTDVHHGMSADDSVHQHLLDAAHQVEQQIFDHCSIKPNDITEASIQSSVEALRSYTVA